jgi:ubiquinone/menaquinone biosynthesis C-methylase UbiE
LIEIDRLEVIMPGGIEMTLEAARHVDIRPGSRWLSVACGTGELELYLAAAYRCAIVGVDAGAWAVERATEKAVTRGLEGWASFEIGDGAALRFAAETFDGVFCSGALCAFFYQGLGEFHRVLRPSGVAVVLDVAWLREPVPEDVMQRWTEGEATVLTREGYVRAFEQSGFEVHLARTYHEPAWWEAYYADRGDALHWREERASYVVDQDYLGVGLFVLQKQ